MSLRLVPLKRAEANAWIRKHHRHNGPVVGDIFRVGVARGEDLVGCAIVGRPVSRVLQAREPLTVEVLRVCTKEGAPKGAASMLYRAVMRAAWALGYTRIVTYTLVEEKGTSLMVAGYRTIGERRKGRSWNTPSRHRVDKHRISDRLLWEASP